ncbi:putative toxin-antitoxin system toxin component, PIN family [Rhizobium sp. VS19-DR104.2]|uniref:putative toxin-antitoxin system toxin component, PIN family n=1 Tax=unclassified Rhizobium TaxID=2613769 RepID=UPI001C5BA0A1|nr:MULTISPECIES: putative toxin-antitoxin system toxin component, PIN family [unclassified Rhizobium]MBZ5761669.1 putative toxin-antitoxin system toxin component, PIN family [Rhizobium sp. VS19-DR96]MBZ5767823.1 putative toxin-antitoxin system toxin component, PIN family [Rhizobium sp. VS19-DR129.2]MBZ5773651.1 putative toxin-antitoxin system toxin component, PIN family [Rhizobium sp. VS19-DRK62.2]MBZ5786440.1 putative toxin-antitoxin system toxin component, PIN family [Rhizobium sp. VS19-DR121
MIVADANVILRGIRSRDGASGFVLREMLLRSIPFAMSPAVVLEYEDVLKRPGLAGLYTSAVEIDVILDALCAMATLIRPWFRFRPFLDDPKDDLIVECALAAGANLIVTDDRHFRHPSVSVFGLTALSAKDFVRLYKRERKVT